MAAPPQTPVSSQAGVGIRATRPNEYWHLDVTIGRLVTGVKVDLHAAVDNFSRRILAWRLADRLDPTTTGAVLADAGNTLGNVPMVVADSGVENVNRHVDALVQAGVVRRVLALVEVSFSNSMIEAWWRSLRHQWLCLHTLADVPTVKRLVAFYVAQHNTVMPHAAFRGQTPDEIYFGRGERVPSQLRLAHHVAREQRLRENRAARCRMCEASDRAHLPQRLAVGSRSATLPVMSQLHSPSS
jgi:putative transposase